MGLSSAMAQAVGFYPPGSYVLLANGETAVAAQRGLRANTPWVICIADKDNMPITHYVCRDSSQPQYTIQQPVTFESVRVVVQAERVRRARERIHKP